MITAVKAIHCTLDLDGHPCRLSYALLPRPSVLLPERTSYDLEITLTDTLAGRTERCLITDVTTDEARAVQYLRRLANGLVTPVTARDVMEDLLGTL